MSAAVSCFPTSLVRSCREVHPARDRPDAVSALLCIRTILITSKTVGLWDYEVGEPHRSPINICALMRILSLMRPHTLAYKTHTGEAGLGLEQDVVAERSLKTRREVASLIAQFCIYLQPISSHHASTRILPLSARS